MHHEAQAFDGQTRKLLSRMVKNLAISTIGRKALLLFGLLVTLLVGVNVLNVVNSYVGRDFMTAIEHRNTGEFILRSLLYAGVFGLSTITAVLYRFCEERLGLLWREWLTRRLVRLYLQHPTYYRLSDRLALNGEVLNPDQRIAEDVKVFTTTTLSFLLMALNGAFTVIAFAGVMWTISPVLFGVAVAYAVFGSIMTIVLGRPLVLLNYSQLDKEATFRSDLVHIREHAESIAVLRRESRVKGRLLKHFDELASNFEKIIRVNRNLGFFTTGYNYMVQIIPALIVAPMFMRGEIEFGVITQSGMAFVHLLGAFSLIVTQFQSISSFAAVIARLGALVEGMADAQKPNPDSIQIETAENLAYENLTLNSTAASQRLIEDLTLEIPVGTRLQVLGPNESANADLFRATAGISEPGSGTIHRPGLDQIMFLPERPYLPPGTLRELLLRTGHEHKIDEQQIKETLTALQLERLIERSEGLDVEQNWDNLLSLGEQQLVAAARVLMAAPRYAVLDRLNSALTPSQVHRLLGLLKQRGITYLHFGEVDDALRHFDAVLELSGTGPWNCKPLTGDTGAGTPHPTGR